MSIARNIRRDLVMCRPDQRSGFMEDFQVAVAASPNPRRFQEQRGQAFGLCTHARAPTSALMFGTKLVPELLVFCSAAFRIPATKALQRDMELLEPRRV